MTRWYERGLRFSCTRCGNCCTGTPGYVWVDEAERGAIATRLGLSVREFGRRYTRLVGTRVSLIERPGGDCVFLDADRRCTIHEIKPRQCITFPFWPRLLADPRNWRQVTRTCPGAGEGALWEADELDRLMDPETGKETLWTIVTRERG